MRKFTIPSIPSSEITPEPLYRERRRFLRHSIETGLGLAALSLAPGLLAAELPPAGAAFADLGKSVHSSQDPLTPYEKVSRYNNFYEFGTDKSEPASAAKNLVTNPWSLTISGEVAKPGTYTLEDILRPHALEERIYRLRCVEGWSMVIPWVGFPLADLLKRFQPTAKARYVAFETLHDPAQMPGQRDGFSLDWPYVEGLRLDEALHPLTLLAVGLYGKVLPNQNGAPIRLVVPWKYGFKSIKSLVKIHLSAQQPPTSWNKSAPDEYGFYANVNPAVDHPRWSQAKERRIGDFFKRETLPFNGYATEVAGLYTGMDLRTFF